MTERLLIRALKGGKDTKIVTLNGKGITKMPSALSKLPGLKTLDLQNNQIRKVCPEISTLTQLTALNLGNNLLEEIPEEMKYLTSLKKLHLFGNKICKFAPGVCGGLQHLILLNLNNNRLTWIPQEVSSYNRLLSLPEEIKFLKKLQKLVLIRNNIEVLPEGLCDLQNLRILDIAGNIIQILPSGFQNLKLREFYCEGNPLFLMKPVNAIQQEDAWSLQEITSRFIMNELEGKSPFIMQAIQRHPQVRNIISQRRKCAICGKYFLTIWLECVEFVPPPKNWKISRNLKLVPLRILICSYKCFNKRGLNLFGIAQV
ncbi:leucine-rich repeat-containing protein 69 isoform X3 [Canis lupus familiaris]|uniref:leucine-rich repeat-containing protein 69 isoform X3 n=1 Tax=Canis lupus dingo TaxID=286419 RepID=UPI000DC68E1F|nr:leucine-rich repeat-containing protein 69 isoform X3 [Canis lupus dingo]XP_038435657.1 leucine-rich repeat-containing protein 69 isoform X3 [Canis lupus familiaris]